MRESSLILKGGNFRKSFDQYKAYDIFQCNMHALYCIPIIRLQGIWKLQVCLYSNVKNAVKH